MAAQRVLATDEQALGLGHPDVADHLHGLAELCQRQERYAEAESLYERALDHFANQEARDARPVRWNGWISRLS